MTQLLRHGAARTFFYLSAAFLLILGGGPQAVAAEAVDRIAAIVNDEAITMRELDERVKMALLMARVQDSVEVRKRTLPQVLRKMIDERLIFQEAKRYKVTLSPKEIDDGLRQIERQNGMPENTLVPELNKFGISTAAVREWISSEMTWLRLSQGLFQNVVKVGDDEINDRIEMISSQLGKPEFNLAEIFLAVDSAAQDDQARSLGERLIEQLHQGAPFQVLASQFSQAATASTGGSLGWVTEGAIDEDLFAVVKAMPPGTISNLIRTGDGYHILALIQRRIAGAGIPGSESTMTFAQMVLPVTGTGQQKEAYYGKAAMLMKTVTTCPEFVERATKEGALGVETVGPTKASQLSQAVNTQVMDIPEGRMSAPLDDPKGIKMIMMCARVDRPAPLPPKEAIRRQIEDERVESMARSHMRDMRRAAFIDTRL